MSISIPDILLNRRWRKWLAEHCPTHQILSDEEIAYIHELHSSPEHKWGNALAFEIENVRTEEMALCVVNVLLELSIHQIIVWVGCQWNHPVVARIPVRGDLFAIFEEAALSEDVVDLASEHVTGRASIIRYHSWDREKRACVSG